MRRRAVTCLFLLVGASCLGAEEAREIVRRAAELDQRNYQYLRTYGYLQRQETRELDHAGQIKSRKIETWEFTIVDGSPYRRLMARNDQPISPEEQKGEEDRLHWNEQQRRMETSEQRARRIAEWQRRLDRQREPAKEVPDAFNFTLLGQEQIGGRTVYRIEGVPRPGYKPKAQFAALFPKVKLRLWIDKNDNQAARIEMEVLDAVSFGGIVVRLVKGTHLVIEQTRVADGVWLPKQFSLLAAARILLVKGINRELNFTFSNYRKLPPDPQVLAGTLETRPRLPKMTSPQDQVSVR